MIVPASPVGENLAAKAVKKHNYNTGAFTLMPCNTEGYSGGNSLVCMGDILERRFFSRALQVLFEEHAQHDLGVHLESGFVKMGDSPIDKSKISTSSHGAPDLACKATPVVVPLRTVFATE